MRILDDHNKLRELASDYRHDVNQDVWKRVQAKLADQESQKAPKRLKVIQMILSIAATAIILVAFSTIIYLESLLPSQMAKGQIESVEDLKITSDYFYTLENVRSLYAVIETENESIENHLFERTSDFPIIFRDNSF